MAMTEKRVERNGQGQITRVTERAVSPTEEFFTLAWPLVEQHLTREHRHAADVVLTISAVPAVVDLEVLADTISEKLVADQERLWAESWQAVHIVVSARRRD